MPSEHARISPSAAERWIHCPGSVALSEQVETRDKSSPFADEGTVAHRLAELKLKLSLGYILKETFHIEMMKVESSEYYTPEMVSAVNAYVQAVLDAKNQAGGEDAICWIEVKVDLSEWIPEGFGTADAVIIGTSYIHVMDLKFGKGNKISAKGNPQLMIYAAGAIRRAEQLGLVSTKKAVITIVQPRLRHKDSMAVSITELFRWTECVVKPQAHKADEGTQEFDAGDWCRFCNAKPRCREITRHYLELAKEDFKDPALLTDEELGDIYKKAKGLATWCTDIERELLKRLADGASIKGLDIAMSRGRRIISDPEEAGKRLHEAGLDWSQIYQTNLRTFSDLEKNVGGKANLNTLLDGLVDYKPGSPKIKEVSYDN